MRNCNYIGNPPMFHSRVSGVGGLLSEINPSVFDQIRCIGPRCQKGGGLRLQVCHKESPPGTCKPVDWTPPAPAPAPVPAPVPAKPAGSALPLVIGAALLLLS